MSREEFEQEMENDAEKAIATAGGGGYDVQSHRPRMTGSQIGPKTTPAGSTTKKVSMKTAFEPIKSPVKPHWAKSLPCPHCQGEISKMYAVKALAIMAKSEGLDLDEELEALLSKSEPTSGKGSSVKGPTNYVGNKTENTAGDKKKGHLSSSRTKGEPVQRKQSPTNFASEEGMEKSLKLPVIVGQPSVVEYSMGMDSVISESIQKGLAHMPPMRNIRAEIEEATGESTQD
jgi:hypothetical protein